MGFRKKEPPTPLSYVLKKLKKSCTRRNTRFYKIIFIVQNCQFLWYFQRIFNFVFFIFSIFFKFRLLYRIFMRVNSILYVSILRRGSTNLRRGSAFYKKSTKSAALPRVSYFFSFFSSIKITIFFNLLAYRSLCQKMNILTCVKQHEAPLPTAQFCPQCISLFRQKIINFPS